MADYNRFYGIRPIDNSLNYFEFNSPRPGHKNVLMWNMLLECYMYSKDAGLTWEKLWGTQLFDLDHSTYLNIDVAIISPDEIKKKIKQRNKAKGKHRDEMPDYQLLWRTVCNALR